MGNIIKCYTDGAATMKQINGKYFHSNGGAAMAIINDSNEIIYSGSKGFRDTTNNYCELYAILMALNYFSTNYSKEDTLEIYSDSAYCVNMLKENGWVYSWVQNGWTRGKKHELIENLDLIKDIWNLMQNVKVNFIKVRGHSGDKINEYVDKLAVKAKKKEDDKTKFIIGIEEDW